MTVASRAKRPTRLADLSLREIEDGNLEVWEGEVVPMSPAGKSHNELALRLVFLFEQFCLTHPDLWRAGDNDGFIVAQNPDTFLSPDAALYRLRAEDDGPWHDFAPELAVEILSPHDSRAIALAKRDLYLRGGTEQVWIIDPVKRSVEVHFAGGRVAPLLTGVLDGEGIAAGLQVDLARLFERPPFLKA